MVPVLALSKLLMNKLPAGSADQGTMKMIYEVGKRTQAIW